MELTAVYSEAIPFLVVTIGFERPYKLTKRVFEFSKETPLTRQNVRETIVRAVDSVALSIARDCMIEIMVLGLGAKSAILGLREFCLLSAFLLAYDVVLMFTFYTAVLALKLEVRIDVQWCCLRPLITDFFFHSCAVFGKLLRDRRVAVTTR